MKQTLSSNEFQSAVNYQIRLLGTHVYIHKFDEEKTGKNSIYNEASEKKYKAPISLIAIPVFDLSEKILTEAGMDRANTDVILKTSRTQLLNKKLLGRNEKLFINENDLVELNGEKFEITKISPKDHYEYFQVYYIGAQKV